MEGTFEWVSVEEALPKDNQRVLCYGKRGGLSICRFEVDDFGKWYFWGMRQYPISVTHWAPLPPQPTK